jgi:hypothetical protein
VPRKGEGTVHGRRTVELSVYPLISLIRKEKLGEPHPLFAGGERYVSPRFAADAERILREELASHGLGDRAALTDFVEKLALVQRAGTEYYGWMTNGDKKYATLVAASGRRAVAVMRAGELVTFERIDSEELVNEFVYRLPDVRPGDGAAVSVRAADVGARQSGAILRRSQPNRPDAARRLEALLQEPRLGGAKLYAAKRDPDGNRRRSPEWLTLLDLISGRWLVHPTLGRGERTINAAPGSPPLIAAKLAELHRTAR